MTPVRLRDLSELDLSQVHAWMQQAPEAPRWSENELAQLVRPAHDSDQGPKIRSSWAADDDTGDLLGFAVASALAIPGADAESELEMVLVSPTARRRGVGRALVQRVVSWAREQHASELWLEVRPSNTSAIALYAQCGFVVAGRRPGYYVNPPEDAVLMRYGIDESPSRARIMTP